MPTKSFCQVDAFTLQPYCGNPAAIVFDADDLATETMQAISREMNLSETVFILNAAAPDADYRVRIFTPRNELPFAGHPTLAAAYAMLHNSRLPDTPIPRILKQECKLGTIPIEVTRTADGLLFVMTQAPPARRPADVEARTVADMLGCQPGALADYPVEIVSTGVEWLIVPLSSVDAVSNLRPDLSLIDRVCRAQRAVGVTVFCLGARDPICRVKQRTFAPGEGVSEDPVCGSGSGSVAAYIAEHGLMDGDEVRYFAEQGEEVFRPGIVLAAFSRNSDDTIITIGGHAVQVISGQLTV
jgi:PhzF family phenazine biosynthesis protein